jgi:hypothetical protein
VDVDEEEGPAAGTDEVDGCEKKLAWKAGGPPPALSMRGQHSASPMRRASATTQDGQKGW